MKKIWFPEPLNIERSEELLNERRQGEYAQDVRGEAGRLR